MRTEKIVWGIILVVVGSILLLQNFGVLTFHWQVVFRFWPVILILIGANLVFSRDDSKSGAIISLLITLLALAFITYKGVTYQGDEDSNWSFNGSNDDDIEDASSFTAFSEEYDASIKNAVLNISGGATRYVLEDTTSDLFYADVERHFGKYSLLRTSRDSSQVLDFKMKGQSGAKFGNDSGNKARIKLNVQPVWDINLEMGAGLAEFDLSPFKISNLKIEGGAASFKIKLGEPLVRTNVSVETGVSEIKISVPQDAACKISVDSGLSSNSFEGFVKQSDGSFETANYKGASRAIHINLQGGLSKFRVQRY